MQTIICWRFERLYVWSLWDLFESIRYISCHYIFIYCKTLHLLVFKFFIISENDSVRDYQFRGWKFAIFSDFLVHFPRCYSLFSTTPLDEVVYLVKRWNTWHKRLYTVSFSVVMPRNTDYEDAGAHTTKIKKCVYVRAVFMISQVHTIRNLYLPVYWLWSKIFWVWWYARRFATIDLLIFILLSTCPARAVGFRRVRELIFTWRQLQ